MNRKEQVFRTVKELPGCSSGEIATIMGDNPNRVTAALSLLFQEGRVVRNGTRGSGGIPGGGYKYYIKEPLPSVQKPVGPPAKPLSACTPRELLEELKRRGYVWDKMYVKQYIEYSKI